MLPYRGIYLAVKFRFMDYSLAAWNATLTQQVIFSLSNSLKRAPETSCIQIVNITRGSVIVDLTIFNFNESMAIVVVDQLNAGAFVEFPGLGQVNISASAVPPIFSKTPMITTSTGIIHTTTTAATTTSFSLDDSYSSVSAMPTYVTPLVASGGVIALLLLLIIIYVRYGRAKKRRQEGSKVSVTTKTSFLPFAHHRYYDVTVAEDRHASFIIHQSNLTEAEENSIEFYPSKKDPASSMHPFAIDDDDTTVELSVV